MIETSFRLRMYGCMTRRNFLFTAASICAASQYRREELSYIQAFLAKHKLPAAQPGRVHQHAGWVYQLLADRFILARRLGERTALPGASARGELTWFHFADGSWRVASPKTRQRPAATTPYFQSHNLPAGWAAPVLGSTADQRLAYFFTVLQCDLTPDGSPESAGTVTWEMPAWFENAQRLEAGFRAGKLN